MSVAAAGAPRAQVLPRLREARLDDFAQIVALQAQHGLETPRTYEEWAHLWLANPVYRGMSAWPIGWVLELPSGRIVGSMSNIPLAYEFGGRPILAATGRGWAVAPEHRAHAFLLLDRVVHQDGVELYLNSSVGPTSTAAVDFFECKPVPRGHWDASAFWVSGYRRFGEAIARRRSVRFARAAGAALGLALYCADRLRSGSRVAEEPGISVEECRGFDERFDEFWQRLRSEDPGVLLAVRTRETLAWHFKHALEQDRLRILAATRGAQLAGYIVLDRKDRRSLGLRRMRVVDAVSLPGEEACLGALLHRALARCRREQIHVLEDPGCSLASRTEDLRRPVPHQRQLPCCTYVYKANDPVLAARLSEPAAWLPSLYDGDASL